MGLDRKSREQVEEKLERWKFALERREMKVMAAARRDTCVNERGLSGVVRLQRA